MSGLQVPTLIVWGSTGQGAARFRREDSGGGYAECHGSGDGRGGAPADDRETKGNSSIVFKLS